MKERSILLVDADGDTEDVAYRGAMSFLLIDRAKEHQLRAGDRK